MLKKWNNCYWYHGMSQRIKGGGRNSYAFLTAFYRYSRFYNTDKSAKQRI